MTDSVAESCIEDLSPDTESYGKIILACKKFLHNSKLQSDFMGIISQLHSCIDQIIEQFKICCKSQEQHKNVPSYCDKDTFTSALKAIVKEILIFVIKILRLCCLFDDNQCSMSLSEVSEVVDFCKKHFHLMIKQFDRLLKLMKSNIVILSSTLGSQLASYLSNNLPTILKFCHDLALNLEICLKLILKESSQEYQASSHQLSEFNEILDSEAVLQVQNIFQLIIGNLLNLQKHFVGMSPDAYSRTIGRNCELLMIELPVIVSHIEDIILAIDDKLEIHEFKFWFKLETSRVADIIKRVVKHKDILQSSVLVLTQYISRSVFTSDLVDLNLLDESLVPQYHSPAPSSPHTDHSTALTQNDPKLTLTQCIQQPSVGLSSGLAMQLSYLFQSHSLVDMEFIVNYPVQNQSGYCPVQGTLSKTCKIPAHRVIVASRCDWFRRALMSGMKESIHRKIEVYESDPELFRMFLAYIYSGVLDCQLSMETLSDLLLLSDRYEFDELKYSCENHLLTLMNEDSVLYLTSIADQCNAKDLKRCAINFILSNPNIIDNEVFCELELELQNEIKDAFGSSNKF